MFSVRSDTRKDKQIHSDLVEIPLKKSHILRKANQKLSLFTKTNKATFNIESRVMEASRYEAAMQEGEFKDFIFRNKGRSPDRSTGTPSQMVFSIDLNKYINEDHPNRTRPGFL